MYRKVTYHCVADEAGNGPVKSFRVQGGLVMTVWAHDKNAGAAPAELHCAATPPGRHPYLARDDGFVNLTPDPGQQFVGIWEAYPPGTLSLWLDNAEEGEEYTFTLWLAEGCHLEAFPVRTDSAGAGSAAKTFRRGGQIMSVLVEGPAEDTAAVVLHNVTVLGDDSFNQVVGGTYTTNEPSQNEYAQCNPGFHRLDVTDGPTSADLTVVMLVMTSF